MTTEGEGDWTSCNVCEKWFHVLCDASVDELNSHPFDQRMLPEFVCRTCRLKVVGVGGQEIKGTPWQEELLDRLYGARNMNTRNSYNIWSEENGVGKSWMASTVVKKFKAFMIVPGAAMKFLDDLVQQYDAETLDPEFLDKPFVVVDIPLESSHIAQSSALGKAKPWPNDIVKLMEVAQKNMLIHTHSKSRKQTTVEFKSAITFLVFSNSPPPVTGKLAGDRFNVFFINGDGTTMTEDFEWYEKVGHSCRM